jgi:hypothetical protein
MARDRAHIAAMSTEEAGHRGWGCSLRLFHHPQWHRGCTHPPNLRLQKLPHQVVGSQGQQSLAPVFFFCLNKELSRPTYCRAKVEFYLTGMCTKLYLRVLATPSRLQEPHPTEAHSLQQQVVCRCTQRWQPSLGKQKGRHIDELKTFAYTGEFLSADQLKSQALPFLHSQCRSNLYV